jgi:hypothetical protein
MAQPPLAIPTLLKLLAQDSDFQIPAADEDVKTALAEYRAVHATANSQKAKAERRQVLAGLTRAWLHLHHLDLAAQVARLSGDHQRILASALGVDLPCDKAKFQKCSCLDYSKYIQVHISMYKYVLVQKTAHFI